MYTSIFINDLLLLISGNCAGKQKNIEKTIKTGTGERLEKGEWVRELKLSCSILKLRKIMVFVILGGIIM